MIPYLEQLIGWWTSVDSSPNGQHRERFGLGYMSYDLVETYKRLIGKQFLFGQYGINFDLCSIHPIDLVIAARKGHLQIIRWIIKRGADVAYRDYETIEIAALKGHSKIVRWFAFQNLECTNQALKWSVISGDFKTVRWLVSKGANVTAYDNILGWAAGSGYLEIVKFLASKGAMRFDGPLEMVTSKPSSTSYHKARI